MADKLESIWDLERQVKDGQQLIALINEVKGLILSVPKVMADYKGGADAKELVLINKQLSISQKELALQITKQKEEERLAAAESKRNAQERILAIRLEAAELRAAQLEIRKNKIADAEAAQMQKRADAEALQAGREKILQMRKEAEEKERLLEEQKELNRQDAISYDFNNKRAQLVGTPKANTDTQFIPQGEMQSLVNERIKYQNAIQASLDVQKQDFALMEAGSISQTEYRKRLVESSVAIEQNRGRVAALNTEIKALIPTEAAEAAELSLNEKITKELSSDYLQLKLAYQGAAERARDMSAALGVQHPLAVQAQNDAKALGMQLKKIDDATAPATAKTGNFLNLAWSGLRKIAYLLPGVGVAGLLAFATDPIIKFISKTKELTGEAKTLNDVFMEGAKSASAQVAVLEVLRAKITDQNALQKDRKVALSEYNKIAEESNKISLQEIDNIKLVNEQIDKQISLVGQQALAKAAEAKIAEMASKLIESDLKLQQAARSAGTTEKEIQESINEGVKRSADVTKNINASLDGFSNKFAIDKAFAPQVQGVKRVGKDLENLLSEKKIRALELDNLIKLLLPNITSDGIKTKDSKSATEKASTKKELDSDFELYKIAQRRKIKILQDGVNDEAKAFDMRISMLQQFSIQSIALNEAQRNEEERVLKSKLAAQLLNVSKAKGTERNNLLVEIKNTNTALRVLNAKYDDENLQIFEDHEKKFNEISKGHDEDLKKQKQQLYKDLQDYVKAYVNSSELNLTEKQFAKLQQLDKDFQEGRIKSIKDYKKQKEEIEEDGNRRDIKIQLDAENELLDLAKINGASTVEIETKIVELKKKLYELDTKNLLTEAEKQAEIDKEKLNASLRLQDQLEATAVAFFEGQFDRQKNALEESKQLIDEETAAKIDAINKQLISDEEKTAKITSLQATAASKKQILDNKQKQLDYKKAVFDRGIAVADVIKDTARAVANDLKDKKFLIPFDIAIGAAQIAAILATPIPKFEKGTSGSPEGWALTDEKGPELYINPDGSIELGNDKPTLRYLERDTQIIPHDQVNQALMKIMLSKNVSDNSEITDAIMWGANQTIKELKKKKTNVKVFIDSGFNSYIKKQVFD